MTRTLLSRLIVLIGVFAACASPVRAADAACPAAPVPIVALPGLRAAVRSGEVVIVAFGSSSTRGAAASDAAHSYPAMLQAALGRAWPTTHVAVLNRGVDGQDAAEELVRLGRDVMADRPDLVIWQVGANIALRDVGVRGFAPTTLAGVRRLREAGIDVMLMDNQRAPRILAAPRHREIEQAVVAIAQTTGVAMFPRGAMMDAWREDGFAYDRFLAPDGLHHNDLGYRCLAEAVAAMLVSAAR